MYKPYEFKEQDAYDFARHIMARTKAKGDELFFRACPYCRPRETDRENLNTFSINLRTGIFKCFRAGCGAHGNMITLSKDFDFSLGNYVDEYYAPKKKYKSLPQPKEAIIPKDKAIEYLQSRGISEEIAKKYQITVQSNKDNILVFPFFDENGKLQFVKYRKTDFDKKKDTAKEWCEENTKPILFGIFQCSGFNTLTICEGQIDSLSLAEAGVENAVSVPTGAKGFTWIPYCWDWITKFKEIIVFGDYEKGKMSLLDDIKKRFMCRVRHVRYEDYKGCKDANEILQKHGRQYLKSCVDRAIDVPVNRVVDIADVETVDIFKIPKLKTGIKELDTLLFGGLPFGYVDIIAGKRGEGKSTLASQIMTQAREQGYKVFAYSGELTNSNFKSWMNFQVVGRANVVENIGLDGSPHWFITNSNLEKLDAWYRDSFYIYDNSVIDGDEKENLTKTVEEVICKYGVKVVLIDNLMTAIDLDAENGTDKYERQSLFVKKLRGIAFRHDALILLVAHRRKSGLSTDLNDEISGSADISNLAGIVISYDRDKDFDNQMDRKIVVSKNRLFGRLNLNGYRVHFDEKSKRIYGDYDNVDYQLGWNAYKDTWIDLDVQDNPFD